MFQALPENQTKVTLTTIAVRTNRYLDPNWQDKLADPEYSKDRQEYAEELIEEEYEDNKLTNEELLKILGDEPIICRNGEGLFTMETAAFITTESFGLGTVNGKVGEIPI